MFEAFSLGPAIIWTRVVFLLLGIWLGTEFFLRLAESSHLSIQHFREHASRYLVAFLLGGRLFAMIAEYRIYLRDPLRVFIVWDGGFSFVGAAVGIALVLYWATRQHRTTFLQWLDVLLPATIFGSGFEWLGKFFAGHAYGHPTDVLWGVTYDSFTVRYTVPVHPVQLYYAALFFFLTFLLLIIRKHSSRAGSETFYGIFFASLITFFLEYFRGDFSIPVFATKLDFVVLIALFLSLGVFAVLEVRLTKTGLMLYEGLLLAIFGGYIFSRAFLPFPTFELRFSQFLAVLAFFATVVYVLVHRRQHPNL